MKSLSLVLLLLLSPTAVFSDTDKESPFDGSLRTWRGQATTTPKRVTNTGVTGDSYVESIKITSHGVSGTVTVQDALGSDCSSAPCFILDASPIAINTVWTIPLYGAWAQGGVIVSASTTMDVTIKYSTRGNK